jgi:hypothetical protein
VKYDARSIDYTQSRVHIKNSDRRRRLPLPLEIDGKEILQPIATAAAIGLYRDGQVVIDAKKSTIT